MTNNDIGEGDDAKKTQKQGATSTLTLFIITAIDPKHQLARIAPLRHN